MVEHQLIDSELECMFNMINGLGYHLEHEEIFCLGIGLDFSFSIKDNQVEMFGRNKRIMDSLSKVFCFDVKEIKDVTYDKVTKVIKKRAILVSPILKAHEKNLFNGNCIFNFKEKENKQIVLSSDSGRRQPIWIELNEISSNQFRYLKDNCEQRENYISIEQFTKSFIGLSEKMLAAYGPLNQMAILIDQLKTMLNAKEEVMFSSTTHNLLKNHSLMYRGLYCSGYKKYINAINLKLTRRKENALDKIMTQWQNLFSLIEEEARVTKRIIKQLEMIYEAESRWFEITLTSDQ